MRRLFVRRDDAKERTREEDETRATPNGSRWSEKCSPLATRELREGKEREREEERDGDRERERDDSRKRGSRDDVRRSSRRDPNNHSHSLKNKCAFLPLSYMPLPFITQSNEFDLLCRDMLCPHIRGRPLASEM